MDDTVSPIRPEPAGSHGGWAIFGIFWIMALGVLTIAQGLIVPIVSAVFVALIFSPVRRALGRLGFPPPVATSLIFALIIGGLGLLIYYGSGAAIARLEQAPQLIELVLRKIETVSGSLQPMMDAGDQIEALAQDPATQVVVVREPGFIAAFQRATPIAIGQIVIALTLAFFLMSSGDMFYEKLVQVMPTLKDKRRALAIARDIELQLSDYLLTITLINAATGVAIGLAMWALGLPDPILFGVAAFVLNFIPYFGALVGVGGTFFAALVTLEPAGAAVWPPLVYYVINTIEGQIVTPVLVGRRLKLNAVVVFVAFAIWAWIWSFMGMLLAMPILLTLKVVSDHVPGMAPIGKFLADRDDLSRSDERIIAFVFRQRRARAKATETPPPASSTPP